MISHHLVISPLADLLDVILIMPQRDGETETLKLVGQPPGDRHDNFTCQRCRLTCGNRLGWFRVS